MSPERCAHYLGAAVAGASPKQLNLVTPDEQARFIAQKSRFKPLHEVMKAAKEPLKQAGCRLSYGRG